MRGADLSVPGFRCGGTRRKKSEPLAGNYLEDALPGGQFHELPRPRGESLHPITGLAELHRVTGRHECRRAFGHLWWS